MEVGSSADSLIIKIIIPSLNASKLIKFDRQSSVEDVIARIEKLPFTSSSSLNISASKDDWQLFFPSDPETSNDIGVWLDRKEKLSRYNLISMKSTLEFKSRSSPTPVIAGRSLIETKSRRGSISLSNSDSGGVDTTSSLKMKDRIKGLLGRFFESRVSQEELMQRKILTMETHTENPIPLNFELVQHVLNYIESKALLLEGIYRISGAQLEVRKLCRSFENDYMNQLNSLLNPHVACSALKLYFREMIPPLIPFDLYEQYLQTSDITDESKRLEVTRQCIQALPTENRNVMQLLVRHLVLVSKNAEINKMTIPNLAIVIGPAILKPRVETSTFAIVTENEKKCSFLRFCLLNCDAVLAEEMETSTKMACISFVILRISIANVDQLKGIRSAVVAKKSIFGICTK